MGQLNHFFYNVTLPQLKALYRFTATDVLKPVSQDFAGIYIHGQAKPFSLETHEVPLNCFRHFSQYSYPLYLFVSEGYEGELDKLLKRDQNIIHITIPVMENIADYDRFVIEDLYRLLPDSAENTLIFHDDGFLIQGGWESYALGFDYIGAPWPEPCGGDKLILHNQDRYPISCRTKVGNGGCCFRKRSKCLEVLNRVQLDDLNWEFLQGHLPDDVFFSYFGFGLSIFKPVTPDEARRWATEPISSLTSFGFHKTDHQIREINSRNARPHLGKSGHLLR